ncbi:unnamed protein product [Paramecium sonneborni]|uniref:Uncharacterized protein n=1 Tax=Paramecium sonneborni TaxID=65129 RepID=A0A8S1KH42_9CILI|nr:unnamed protein product [Paramecium sonneborni]
MDYSFRTTDLVLFLLITQLGCHLIIHWNQYNCDIYSQYLLGFLLFYQYNCFNIHYIINEFCLQFYFQLEKQFNKFNSSLIR